MLKLRLQRLGLKKRIPLAISRGVSHGSENLFVFVEQDEHVGIGECAPSTIQGSELLQEAEAGLQALVQEFGHCSIREIYHQAMQRSLPAPAVAALDMALWDLQAKRAGLPLYEYLGFALPQVASSVTIGINPPERTRELVPEILQRTGGRFLKIKLGSPEGIEHDQAHFEAARRAAQPFGVGLRVDANGGWTVDDAQRMMFWLAERDVDYVEQPLPVSADDDLPRLFSQRPLPIFVDESCRLASDVPRLAHCVDGVNFKLMKCGGITGALAIIATARAHQRGVMVGCMGESSVAISAAAALTAAVDHIDLDSQLNLDPDPAQGCEWRDGKVIPTTQPGHGGSLISVL